MTLVNRVSAFFLAALAIVLVSYSILLYVLVRQHLYHQFDHELQSTLNTLVAAVEVEDDDVKFEPSDHMILSSGGSEVDDVRWIVLDKRGGVIDHSRNLETIAPNDPLLAAIASAPFVATGEPVDTGAWRILKQRLAAPQPKPEGERSAIEHSQLIVAAARSPVELQATMRRLMLVTTLLPLGAWLMAAVIGRWYCRQILRPVQTMANKARSMTKADFDVRLPADSGDELAELGIAFNSLLDRLREAYERQQRFTGDAAHQLRTPLTVLLGQIDVGLRRPRTVEEYQQTLATLRQEATELRQIVESLLFLARSDDDAAAPDLETVDLGEWLTTYRERWQNHPRATDLSFEAGRDLRCRVSTALLAQLLDNLIDNATKYSEPGTPVAVRADGADAISLSVEDRGMGMTAEDRASVFKPFFRSAQARQAGTPGTGLGLAVASRIATALGGELTCASEPGQGSRFTLTLPRA